MYSWGRNESGELGLQGVRSIHQPKKINFFDYVPVKDVKCGTDHSLVISENKEFYFFGNNKYKQCRPSLNVSDSLAHFEDFVEENTVVVPTPIPFKSVIQDSIKDVILGFRVTFILNAKNEVLGIGRNDKTGKLGVGYEEDKSSCVLRQMVIPNRRKVLKVFALQNLTYVLLDDYSLWMCGNMYVKPNFNDFGPLIKKCVDIKSLIK